jgi:predicted nucleic acid-binding protein
MADLMVVDATVVAKWFLKDPLETDTDLADDILIALLAGDLELHAPRILSYEVSGLLARACLTRPPGTGAARLTKDRAVQCVHEFFGLPIQIADATEDEALESLEMSVTYSKGLYDMTYIRLAQQLDCRWCTADRKVLQALAPGFPAERVLLLSSLRAP